MILIALIIVSALLLLCAFSGCYRAGYSQAWREIAELDVSAADALPPELAAEIAKRAGRQ